MVIIHLPHLVHVTERFADTILECHIEASPLSEHPHRRFTQRKRDSFGIMVSRDAIPG